MLVKVKICGMTNYEDCIAAINFGADALGFIFHPPSPRFISPGLAAEIIRKLPPFVTTVGVFVKKTPGEIQDIIHTAGIDVVQLHGDEPPEVCHVFHRVIKVIRVKDGNLDMLSQYNVSAFLLDTYTDTAYGGSGSSFDWDIAKKAKISGPIILAGGLTPENVKEAVQKVMPYGVDVVSGVEGEKKGKKDHLKMKAFIENSKSLKQAKSIF